MIGPRGLSLHHRLLLAALLPAALLASLITGVVLHRGTRMLDQSLLDHGTAVVSFLAPAAEYGVISGNRGPLESLLQAAVDQPEVSAAAAYDERGALLASRGRLTVLTADVLQRVRSGVVRDTDPSALAMIAPIVSAEIQIDDEPLVGNPSRPDRGGATRVIGWVHVELDTGPANRAKESIIAATLIVLAIGLSLTGALALRLARSISQPVAALVSGVERMASGELDVTIAQTASARELAALEEGFNSMARAIAESHRTLQSRIDDATAKLAYQARHDPLTGLPNRRVFEQKLEESVNASRRAGDHGALCFIDLDRFKIVNDTCGHAAGDELLMRIALLIRDRVRDGDIVCRIGGDEFALILRGCSRDDALRLAESLRAGVSDFRFDWHGHFFSVGASVGLTCIDGTQSDPSEILIAADAACYEAKRSGRNRVVEYRAGSNGKAAESDAQQESD